MDQRTCKPMVCAWQRAYGRSPQKEKDLDLFIGSFNGSEVFADFVRSHVSNVFSNELHDFRLSGRDDIIAKAKMHEHDWILCIEEGMTEYWTEFYLSSWNNEISIDYKPFHSIKAGLYDRLRQNGHTLKEALDAVMFFDHQYREISNESLGIYSENELRLVAESIAEYVMEGNGHCNDEVDFVAGFVRLFLEALSAGQRTTVRSIIAGLTGISTKK